MPRMLRNVLHGPGRPFPLTKKFLAPNANSGETEKPLRNSSWQPWEVALELAPSFYRGGGGFAQETRRLAPGRSECGARAPGTVLAW